MSVPTLELFEGLEDFWSDYLSSRASHISTSITWWHEDMDSDTKESLFEKQGRSLSDRYSSLSQEERSSLGSLISRGHSLRSTEARITTSNLLSERCKSFWSRISPEQRLLRGAAIALGQSSMSSDAKDSWLRSQREAWRLMSPEYLASILSTFSRAQKSRWLEASDSQRNAWVQAIYRGNNKANIPEIILGLYLESRFPHLFVYNGDGKAGFVVGGKIPDFVNSRDELLVELFGDYWHSPADESELVAYYASRGWRCKVVWEDQVYQEHELDIAFDIGRLGA